MGSTEYYDKVGYKLRAVCTVIIVEEYYNCHSFEKF